MMKLFVCILVVGGYLVLSGCAEKNASNLYTGNGELIHLEKPGLFGSEGWKVLFDEFPLSGGYSATYSFAGLPDIKKLDSYTAYLYIPPTLERETLAEAVLEMFLYADGALISEFHAPMKKWVCTSYSLRSQQKGSGDGLEKSFYHPNINIPANPETRYQLKVNYVPSDQVRGNDVGRFYLRIGGSK